MSRQRKQIKNETENAPELIEISDVTNHQTKIRKSNTTKKKENGEPNCYSLFDFTSTVFVDDDKSVQTDKNEEKSTKRERKTSRGPQDIVKESDVLVSGDKKNESDNPKARGKYKVNRENRNEDTKSVSGKRRNKTSTERIGETKKGKSKSKGEGKRTKQHDESVEREVSDKTSGNQAKLKNIDISKYELTEFPPSDKVMTSMRIQFGPIETSNPLLVEIVIDNKRYVVSSWSVKDETYTQGLDSNYIVRNFRKGTK